jgi:DNA polymerase-3 subunit alpha
VETLLRRAQAAASERVSGQAALFGAEGRGETLRLAEVADWPPMERLGYEAEAVGFHITAHPLDAYAGALRRLGVIASSAIAASAAAGIGRVRLAGTLISVKERPTRTGTRMAWARLSDSGGSFEITLFSETLARVRDLLQPGTSLLASVDLRLEGETLRLTAHDVSALEAAAATLASGIRVWLRHGDGLAQIRDLLAERRGGKGRVRLMPRLAETDQAVEVTLPGGFNVTPLVAQTLATLPGVERVEAL